MVSNTDFYTLKYDIKRAIENPNSSLSQYDKNMLKQA